MSSHIPGNTQTLMLKDILTTCSHLQYSVSHKHISTNTPTHTHRESFSLITCSVYTDAHTYKHSVSTQCIILGLVETENRRLLGFSSCSFSIQLPLLCFPSLSPCPVSLPLSFSILPLALFFLSISFPSLLTSLLFSLILISSFSFWPFSTFLYKCYSYSITNYIQIWLSFQLICDLYTVLCLLVCKNCNRLYK